VATFKMLPTQIPKAQIYEWIKDKKLFEWAGVYSNVVEWSHQISAASELSINTDDLDPSSNQFLYEHFVTVLGPDLRTGPMRLLVSFLEYHVIGIDLSQISGAHASHNVMNMTILSSSLHILSERFRLGPHHTNDKLDFFRWFKYPISVKEEDMATDIGNIPGQMFHHSDPNCGSAVKRDMQSGIVPGLVTGNIPRAKVPKWLQNSDLSAPPTYGLLFHLCKSLFKNMFNLELSISKDSKTKMYYIGFVGAQTNSKKDFDKSEVNTQLYLFALELLFNKIHKKTLIYAQPPADVLTNESKVKKLLTMNGVDGTSPIGMAHGVVGNNLRVPLDWDEQGTPNYAVRPHNRHHPHPVYHSL
jgi:hypothetical protein